MDVALQNNIIGKDVNANETKGNDINDAEPKHKQQGDKKESGAMEAKIAKCETVTEDTKLLVKAYLNNLKTESHTSEENTNDNDNDDTVEKFHSTDNALNTAHGKTTAEVKDNDGFDQGVLSSSDNEHCLSGLVKRELESEILADRPSSEYPCSISKLPSTITATNVPNILSESNSRDLADNSTADTSQGGKIKKKSRRRGSAWSDAETEFLMEIWARQTEIAKDTGGEETATCATTYRLIAREMDKKQYDKNWEQCKTRIHTLKRAYKITKDEINSGSQTITYCRHFDMLGIISGDNADISAGVLAANLEQKRKQMEAENKFKPRAKQPVKRKLVVGEPPATMKRPTIPSSNSLPSFCTFNQPASNVTATCSSPLSTSWYTSTPPQTQISQSNPEPKPQSVLQLSLSTPVTPAASYQSMLTPPDTPLYPYHSPPGSLPAAHAPVDNSAVKQIVSISQSPVKSENGDLPFRDQATFAQTPQWNSIRPGSHAQNKHQQGQGHHVKDDLERMRLDLELKKLEVERNKLEMEERQRREDRDHQYRMMQLLLFGLGQQNISQLLNGQGSDVAHAHGADLARLLESGLVPGGPQTVNEKGLSFSEL